MDSFEFTLDIIEEFENLQRIWPNPNLDRVDH